LVFGFPKNQILVAVIPGLENAEDFPRTKGAEDFPRTKGAEDFTQKYFEMCIKLLSCKAKEIYGIPGFARKYNIIREVKVVQFLLERNTY
jgi:hypothetical protein